MKPYAILGCGPSGLLAAHACALSDRPFTILSRKRKSPLGGAQYLHEWIPGIAAREPEAWIHFQMHGDEEGYRRKVYGDTQGLSSPSFVSFSHYADGKDHAAWNLRAAYEKLWDIYEPLITSWELNAEEVEVLLESAQFDRVISTVPLSAICRSEAGIIHEVHTFTSARILIANKALMDVPDNTIAYDGTKDHSWYRVSKIFGTGSTEWATTGTPPPIPELVIVRKPIRNNCDCWPEITKLGRFGAWDKRYLVSDVFRKTLELLASEEETADAL